MFNFEEKSFFNSNTKLSDLFTVTGIHDTNPSKQDRTRLFETSNGHIIQGWLNFSSHAGYTPSLDIVPSDKLIEAVNESMLQIDYDQIYFEAIPFENGKLKLYARYNQIIGSRFLGWYDSSELIHDYTVMGESREVGAIGIFEPFRIIVKAVDEETAKEETRTRLYAENREHVHIINVRLGV